MKWFCIILVFVCHAKQEVIVERSIIDKIGRSSFYNSIDYFKNDKKTETFCTELNATCETPTNCLQCKCKKNDVFVSYQYGCEGYDAMIKRLNGKKCLTYDPSANVIPTMTQLTCSLLYSPSTIDDISSFIYDCGANNVYFINPCNGTQQLLWPNKDEGKVVINNKYDKCIEFKNLTHLKKEISGMVLKVDILCGKHNSPLLETCFIVKVNGQYSIDAPTPTTKSTITTLSSSNSTIKVTVISTDKSTAKEKEYIIIALVVSLFVVILTIIVLYFCWRRRRTFTKEPLKKTFVTVECGEDNTIYAKPSMEEKKSEKKDIHMNINEYEVVNESTDSYEYVYSLEDKVLSNNKDAENIYYQAGDGRQTASSDIYSSEENPMYGLTDNAKNNVALNSNADGLNVTNKNSRSDSGLANAAKDNPMYDSGPANPAKDNPMYDSGPANPAKDSPMYDGVPANLAKDNPMYDSGPVNLAKDSPMYDSGPAITKCLNRLINDDTGYEDMECKDMHIDFI